MAYQIDLSGRVAFVTGASSGLGAHSSPAPWRPPAPAWCWRRAAWSG
jgi:hypothetical protein